MNVTVRDASSVDAALYRTLWPELGLDDPPVTDAQAAAAVPRMLVAELDGRPAGVAVCDVEGTVGFLRQIMVASTARRCGVGTALLNAVRARLCAHGAQALRLNVKRDNDAAIALYERVGFAVDFSSAALRVSDRVRIALPGSETPLAVYPPSPLEEGLLEAQFFIPSGQLAWFREQGDLVRAVRVAGMNGEPLGVMRFSPRFPGAFPFRATSPAAARALLGEAEQRRVDPTAAIGLVVERDTALIDRLLEAGATLRFWMVQMVAPLD